MNNSLPLLISSMDFISLQPKLYVDYKSRFKNVIGGSLSVLSLLTISTIMCLFFSVFVKREKYSVVYNIDIPNTKNYDFEVKSSQFPLILSLGIPGKGPYPDQDKIFSISMINSRFVKINDNTTGLIKVSRTDDNIPIKKCSMANLGGYNSELTHILSTVSFLDLSFCYPISTNFSLYGVPAESDHQSFINIYLNKCVNDTTINKTDCYPEDIINSKLEPTRFQTIFIDYQANHGDFSKPIKPLLKNDGVQVAYDLNKRYTYGIRKIQYDSDIGMIFTDTQTTIKYQVEDRVSDVVKSNSPCFISVGIMISRYINLYNRNYYKMQNLLADVGGIIKSTILIVTAINSFLTDRLYYNTVGAINYNCQNDRIPEKLEIIHSKPNLKQNDQNNSSFMGLRKESTHKIINDKKIKANSTYSSKPNYELIFTIIPKIFFHKKVKILQYKKTVKLQENIVKSYLDCFKIIQTVDMLKIVYEKHPEYFSTSQKLSNKEITKNLLNDSFGKKLFLKGKIKDYKEINL
jgi:hypothetical protein